MIKNTVRKLGFYETIYFVRKVGLGKIVLNFIVQRIFRVNSSFPFSINFTSTFIGNDLGIEKPNAALFISFAASPSLYIQSLNGIRFGRNVLIGPNVKIISANHSMDASRKSVNNNPIVIGDNVWIGCNVVILPGVTISNNVIVGAGSVVTKSINEPDCVVAGNPARIIKRLL